jgi:hypothetical protein
MKHCRERKILLCPVANWTYLPLDFLPKLLNQILLFCPSDIPATSWKTCFLAIKCIQVTPSGLFFSERRKNTPSDRQRRLWESTTTWLRWNRVKPSETKWRQSETEWHQVKPSDAKVKPSDTKWNRVKLSDVTPSPSDNKWHQVKPSDTKWNRVTPSETEWHQVNRSDTNVKAIQSWLYGAMKWRQSWLWRTRCFESDH